MPEWSAEDRAREWLDELSLSTVESPGVEVEAHEAAAFAEECYRAGQLDEHDRWAEREAAVCPEDVAFDDFIRAIRARAERAEAERDELRALLDARDDHTAEEVGYAAVLARAERAEAERDEALRTVTSYREAAIEHLHEHMSVLVGRTRPIVSLRKRLRALAERWRKRAAANLSIDVRAFRDFTERADELAAALEESE